MLDVLFRTVSGVEKNILSYSSLQLGDVGDYIGYVCLRFGST